MGMIDYARRKSRAALMRGETPAWIANSKRAGYITQVVLSTPDWVDRAALRALSKVAAERTSQTGVLHVLDHIVPMNHPRVCGLTVPWNLQVITWRANASKSNRWVPEQMNLFETEG